MKTFGKSVIIFFIFMIGTAALIHADRQCAAMNGGSGELSGLIADIKTSDLIDP